MDSGEDSGEDSGADSGEGFVFSGPLCSGIAVSGFRARSRLGVRGPCGDSAWTLFF